MENGRGKLAGYAWNLIRDYPFTLVVHEVDGPSKKSYDPKLRLEHKAFSGDLGSVALSLDNPGRDKL